MNNTVVIFSVSEETQIRIGVPSERPEEAIAVLLKRLPKFENISAARLGLMEVINTSSSMFTYTIGIEYSSPINGVDQKILEILKSVKVARWPISLVESSSKFFTNEAEYFYRGVDKKSNPFKSFILNIFRDQ